MLIPEGGYEQRMQVCQHIYFCFLAHGVTHLYSNNQNTGLRQMIYGKDPAATESSVTWGLIQPLLESSAPDEPASVALKAVVIPKETDANSVLHQKHEGTRWVSSALCFYATQVLCLLIFKES